MRWTIVLSLSSMAATPAPAQVSPPPAAAAHPDGSVARRSQLFIAPSGKPFRAAPGESYPVAKWFAGADTDHDGKLTMAELRDDAARFFAELDTDHDGEISPEEVHAYETVIAPEIQTGSFGDGRPGGFSHGGGRHGGGHRGGGGGRGSGGGVESGEAGTRPQAVIESNRGAGRYSVIDTPEPVAAADSDLDRSITLKEFKAKAVSDFQELDPTNQGYLTLAGLPRTAAQIRPSDTGHGDHHRRGR